MPMISENVDTVARTVLEVGKLVIEYDQKIKTVKTALTYSKAVHAGFSVVNLINLEYKRISIIL